MAGGKASPEAEPESFVNSVSKAAWAEATVEELGSPNVVQLLEFKEAYGGMGRRNGDREEEAKAAVPEGTKVISMGGGMPEHALLPFDEIQKYIAVAWEKNQPSPLEYGSSDLLVSGDVQPHV